MLSQLAAVLKCKIGKLPITYLGLPLGANMRLKKNWLPVSQKFETRLSAWKSKMLSFGGKATLLKNVLGSLPLYYMSLFRAPLCVLNELESIRRKFFWGRSDSGGKICWIAWDRILAPKNKGGLGIGSLNIANLALLSKWIWKYKSDPNSLWAKVIRAIHTTRRSDPNLPVRKTIAGPWKSIPL
ncbi:hypothetical protein SSX86_033214, partial [Deinandra increscens subsp. villosa]